MATSMIFFGGNLELVNELDESVTLKMAFFSS